jgi:putative spermidine/putrescine transport system ATP-binding protein
LVSFRLLPDVSSLATSTPPASLRRSAARAWSFAELCTVLVTHDQQEALAIADRVVVMNPGPIEQTGSPIEVCEEPATHFVGDFIGTCNMLPARPGSDGEALICFGPRVPIPAGERWTEAVVAIRPHHLRLVEPDVPGQPSGFVTRVISLGASARIQVDVDGQQFTVQASAGEACPLERGARVGLEMDPRHVRPLRSDT